ncbi:MAG TPA: HemK/PrmC family methyltransferase [Burkholderiales bacterium]|nr:HemK/PrmC family methyltransferase [Burkholderiales bacterium]
MSGHSDVVAAYERGQISFCGLDLAVAAGVLVPRAETELLARTAVAILAQTSGAEARVIDMCCGAGNLACAIATLCPHVRVWASDFSAASVRLTRRNVEACGLSARVWVHEGDLFGALTGLQLEDSIDVIVCNPPYISDTRLAGERADLLRHEPPEAFAAGPYGISMHQRVIRDAAAYLRPGGVLLLEIGAGQQSQVEALFARRRAYEKIQSVRDAAGEARVVYALRQSGA